MANNKSNVIKFTDAVGSAPDSPENGPLNAIDLYENTRFSSDQGKETFWEGVLPKVTEGIVAIDLGFFKGKERATLFTLSYSEKDPVPCHIDEKTGEKHYDGKKKVPPGYTPIGGYQSAGNTNAFQRFVFKNPVKAKTIRVAFDKNSDGSNWLSITGSRLVLNTAVTDNTVPVPVTPIDNTDEPDVKLGEPLNVIYPEPKTKDPKARSIPFDESIAKKNRGTKLNVKLPLLANKKDAYGLEYTDFAKLFQVLGLTFKAPILVDGNTPALVPCSKNYNFATEVLEVHENNNSGGKSKRFDFDKIAMAMFEITMWLNNQSKDKGDEESLKYGGAHHSRDGERQVADCLIVQIANDGKSACTQLEPSHMDDDPHGYGDKFNKVDLDLPSLMGNPHSLKFIKINDLPNKRVIVFAAIKFDKVDGWTDWTIFYQTEIYDGMGGGRGLKDPYRQWAFTALGELDECGITMRMDEQPGTEIEKGEHYNNARITELVDYATVA